MEKKRYSADILYYIQKAQDLLAEKLDIGLVLVDYQGQELTIPSRLPINCLQNEDKKECRQEILSQIKKASFVEYAVVNQCHRQLYTFTFKTGFRINERELFLLAGRIQDLKKLESCMDLILSIYSLPLVIEKSEKNQLENRFTSNSNSEILHTLTSQELNILGFIGKGLSNKAIASELFISTNTVKSHVSRLLQKLNLTNRTDIALFAFEHHITQKG